MGNALVIAGVVVSGDRQRVVGLGVAQTAAFIAVGVVLLYLGFTSQVELVSFRLTTKTPLTFAFVRRSCGQLLSAGARENISMRRHLATACVLSIVLDRGRVRAGIDRGRRAGHPHPSRRRSRRRTSGTSASQIIKYRHETWLGASDAPAAHARHAAAERSNDREQRELILNAWKAKAEKRRRQAAHPPRREQWLCIHRYERHPHQGWATDEGERPHGGLTDGSSGFHSEHAGLDPAEPPTQKSKRARQIVTALEQIVGRRACVPQRRRLRYCMWAGRTPRLSLLERGSGVNLEGERTRYATSNCRIARNGLRLAGSQADDD